MGCLSIPEYKRFVSGKDAWLKGATFPIDTATIFTRMSCLVFLMPTSKTQKIKGLVHQPLKAI